MHRRRISSLAAACTLFCFQGFGLGLGLGVAVRSSAGADTTADVVFQRDVAPIFKKHCSECHAADSPEARLDLSSRETALRGSRSGPILAPGQSKESLVVQLLAAGSKPHMPPEGQLDESEIAAVARWIDGLKGLQLAESQANRDLAAAAREHWAFRRPERRLPPSDASKEGRPDGGNDGWDRREPIDLYVQARLAKSGLSPAPPAERAELIRRVTFDLIGLPPSPEEVREFAADESVDAYERLVDRLLASPAHGERWARHWLDLARYADSGGYHEDLDRPYAWRYRDYVIRSLNADKPYSLFVREQLAGDELDRENLDALAATAFCRNGPSNDDNMGNNAQDREKYRLDLLDDVVSTTSAVYLGLTVGCARCHDHKFDPIPQTDYYQLLAIFNTSTRKNLPLGADGRPVFEQASEKIEKTSAKTGPGVMVVFDSSSKPRPTHLLYRGELANRGPEVQPGVPQVLARETGPYAAAPTERSTGRRLALADWIVAPDNPLSWRVIANRLWQHHFGRGLVGTPSNFGMTGEPPTHPELLDWLALELAADGGQLKAMHRRMTLSATYRQSSDWRPAAAANDPENRLLARMNKTRLQAEMIRDAILTTSGTLNRAAGGPGIKPRIPAELLVASQRNKWPLVTREGADLWRRGVYVYVKRQLLLPMLELFDSPSTNQTCEQRSISTVPTQALVLMNDRFTQEQAEQFAERVERETAEAAESTDSRQLERRAERALWLAFSRAPSKRRVDEAVEFLRQQTAAHDRSSGDRSSGDKASGAKGEPAAAAGRAALVDLCHVLLNCNEFVYVD